MKATDVQLLLGINNAIATIRNKNVLFRMIVEKLRPIYTFDAAIIIVFEDNGKYGRLFVKEVLPQFLDGTVQALLERFRFEVAKTPVARFVAENKAVRLIDYVKLFSENSFDAKNFPPAQLVKYAGLKQGMGAMLRCGGELVGTFILVSKQPDHFSEADFPLFEQIASQVAIGVSNTLGYEKLEVREREKALQLAVSNALVTIKDRDEMFHRVATEINKVIACDFFGVRIQRTDGEVEGVANFAKMPDDTFKSVPDAKQVFINDLKEHFKEVQSFTSPRIIGGATFKELKSRYEMMRHVADKYGVKEMMYVPLQTASVLSSLVLASAREGGFTERDAELIGQLAPQISLALENLFAFENIERLRRELEQEKTYLLDELKTTFNFDEIIGASGSLKAVLCEVEQVAPTDATVLIQGETGTGKELVARALHNLSPRKSKPLVKVNCAALPSQLIESELFGHEKGSFTGAHERRLGKFELADGGTIFLDEIGEMPMELQSKLLRILQEKELERLGGKEVLKVDVRIIAATNRELGREVAAGRFRNDLYFRLNVFPLTMPPLRERREDIPALAMHFIEKYSKKMGKPIESITRESLQRLMEYEWPGNIRELEHIIERAVILSASPTLRIESLMPQRTELSQPTLPQITFAEPRPASSQPVSPKGVNESQPVSRAAPKTLQESERAHIVAALTACGGKVSGKGGAAESLGLKPTTLESRMKKLGIVRARGKLSAFPFDEGKRF
ncbi:MAG: sigma 54-interacting transcriptional regulator [Rhizobacter sp.]|nr:sigma 54-interacting transcriptional regulator [Chlorobiales bacterium]